MMQQQLEQTRAQKRERCRRRVVCKSLSAQTSLIVAFFALQSFQTNATKITWHANEHDNDPAKTAPRSQKYWDEHNILRPDYAKTDAELIAERIKGGKDDGGSRSWWILHPLIGFIATSFAVGMAAGLIFLYFVRRNTGGDRLGGNSPGTRWSLDEQALDIDDLVRAARLERFQAKAAADKVD